MNSRDPKHHRPFWRRQLVPGPDRQFFFYISTQWRDVLEEGFVFGYLVYILMGVGAEEVLNVYWSSMSYRRPLKSAECHKMG